MATEGACIKVPSLVCGSVSLATHQYKFVKIGVDDKTVELVSSPADRPIGVLQNKPGVGESAEVVGFGMTKVIAGETIAHAAAGQLVGADADGLLALAVDNEIAMGICMEAVTDTNVCSVWLTGASVVELS